MLNSIQRNKIIAFFNEARPSSGYKSALESAVNLSKAKRITIDKAIAKYEEYLRWWNMKFKNRDPRYIARNDEKFDFITFLLNNHFDKTYKIEKSERDRYIFGDYDPDELERALTFFLKKIGLEPKEPKDVTE